MDPYPLPNPILRLLEASILKADPDLNTKLVDLIKEYSETDRHIDSADLMPLLERAYNQCQLQLFFIILINFNRQDLIACAVQLMSSPLPKTVVQQTDPELLEKILLLPCKSHGETEQMPLIHYLWLTKLHCDNAIIISRQCSIKFLTEMILLPQKADNHNPHFINRLFNHKCDYMGITLLTLLKADAQKMLLCPWMIQTNTGYIEMANVVYYGEFMQNDPLLAILLEKKLLTIDQIFDCRVTTPTHDWHRLFRWAIVSHSTGGLNFCIEKLGKVASQNLLLKFYDISEYRQENCVLLAVKQLRFCAYDTRLLYIILFTLGIVFQETLESNNFFRDAIFDLCFKYIRHNHAEITALIIKYLDNIDFLRGIYHRIIERFHHLSLSASTANNLIWQPAVAPTSLDISFVDSRSATNIPNPKYRFLNVMLERVIELFENRNSSAELMNKRMMLYQSLVSQSLTPQDVSDFERTTQLILSCCMTRQFALTKILFNFLAPADKNKCLSSEIKLPVEKAFMHILYYLLMQYPKESIKPLVELFDICPDSDQSNESPLDKYGKTDLEKMLLRKIPFDNGYDDTLPFIQFIWLSATKQNASLLHRYISPTHYQDVYLSSIHYEGAEYANIINLLFELNKEHCAMDLLFLLAEEACLAFRMHWTTEVQLVMPGKIQCIVQNQHPLYYLCKNDKLDDLKVLMQNILHPQQIIILLSQIKDFEEYNFILRFAIANNFYKLLKCGFNGLNEEQAKKHILHIFDANGVHGERCNLFTYTLWTGSSRLIPHTIEMIFLMKLYLGNQVTSALQLQCKIAPCDFLMTLCRINDKKLSQCIIDFFQDSVELSVLLQKLDVFNVATPQKDELRQIIQQRIDGLQARRALRC